MTLQEFTGKLLSDANKVFSKSDLDDLQESIESIKDKLRWLFYKSGLMTRNLKVYMKVFHTGEKTFYGGETDGIIGDISIDGMDFILDLIDEYIELVESLSR